MTRHPELQSKWEKSFRARRYYVYTIGNITEDAIKKYIQEQSDESRKEENKGNTGLQKYFDVDWKSEIET